MQESDIKEFGLIGPHNEIQDTERMKTIVIDAVGTRMESIKCSMPFGRRFPSTKRKST